MIGRLADRALFGLNAALFGAGALLPRHAARNLLAGLVAVMVGSAMMAPVDSLWSKNLLVNGEVEVRVDPQGCSPGYWKNHKSMWDGNDPDYTIDLQWDDNFNDWFDVTYSQSHIHSSKSFYQVLGTGGGSYWSLARHAAAAAANADAAQQGHLVSYPFTPEDVYDLYRAAVVDESISVDDAKQLFEAAEENCPLDNGGYYQSSSVGGETLRTTSSATDPGAIYATGLSFTDPFAPQTLTQESETLEPAPTVPPEGETSELSIYAAWDGTGTPPGLPDECAGMTIDTVYLLEPGETYVSGDSRDLVLGSDLDDVIETGGGDDCIVAYAGNDTVNAGAGADLVLGGGGDDNLHGGADADTLYGQPGLDRIWGEAGDDVIDGGADDDLCLGGAKEDEDAGTVDACEPYPAPEGLTAVYDATGQATMLTWTPVTEAATYDVHISLDAASWVPLGETEDAFLVHPDVPPGATYYYAVAFVDEDGFASERSDALSVLATEDGAEVASQPSSTATTTSPAFGPPPANPRVSYDARLQTVTLSWQPVVAAYNYRVYASETSGGGYVLQAETQTFSATLAAPASGQTQYYVVTAVRGDGAETAYSAETSVTAAGATATPTPEPTLAPTQTPQPTATPAPTQTATPAPTQTATPEPTATPTQTATPEPTATPANTPEATATP